MKCEHAIDLIVDSLMDSLDEAQQRELSAHLQTCASCAAEADRMKEVWVGLGRLRVPAASPRAAFDLGRRLSTARSRRPAVPLLAAAAVAFLMLGGVAGFLARGGASPAGGSSPEGSAFLLLVRGDDARQAVPGAALVAEYAAWADSLAGEGRLLGANKLTDEPGRWISGAPAGDPRTRSDVSGYFVVVAADYAEAVEIARTSPHIRYGGTFEIRQVETLPPAPSPGE
jgi:hypothetical protein